MNRPHIKSIIAAGDNTVEITTECPGCKARNTLKVDCTAYTNWLQDTLIQHAFPELNKDQHEWLQTGFCNQCWDALNG